MVLRNRHCKQISKVGNRPPGDCGGGSRQGPFTGFQSAIANLPPEGRQLPQVRQSVPFWNNFEKNLWSFGEKIAFWVSDRRQTSEKWRIRASFFPKSDVVKKSFFDKGDFFVTIPAY